MSAHRVTLTTTTLTFSLPDDFGRGWDYTHVHLYGAHHQWAGSYDRSEVRNFAHDALSRIAGVGSSSLYEGISCTVSFDVDSIEKATAIQQELQTLVDAFPAREEREISVCGAHNFDSEATECEPPARKWCACPSLPIWCIMCHWQHKPTQHWRERI